MGLRELKMERTRQLIADKAFELFTEHGFDQTTIEQIAAAAEVGPRTLYRYYQTKEALIVTFVETHLFAAVDRLRAQPDDIPVTDALYALIDSVIATTMSNEDRVLAVYRLAGCAPSVKAQFSGMWVRWCDEVADEVARRSKGRSADMTARLAAAATNIVIEVSVRAWVESGGKANIRRLANQALDLLRTGEVPFATPAGRR
nr:TetR family transcriptional regulator [Kibdelosporangium sp. MJ126-NF4]CEL22596.1 Transcriptional regulator, TetR family [Kibdelosporangium sp. MJ126-NF4]CTQ89738.1 Transcriptional regulator, TetR family [Kibdelosporangium sp. MJ126-NF4]